MSERRVAIPRQAAAEFEQLLGKRAAIDGETAGLLRGLAYGLAIDPRTVVRIDTDRDELVLEVPDGEAE